MTFKGDAAISSSNKHYSLDLGFFTLLQEWKQLFTFKGLKQDLLASVSVTCISIPLSLAIALASGVSATHGLIGATLGSLLCALLGGTPLAVSGPTAAMTVLIASIMQNFGLAGVVFTTMVCGLLQILTGFFKLGKFIRYIPLPVIAGFKAGIGVLIVISQLPKALGLPPPAHSEALAVLTHLYRLMDQAQINTISLAGLTLILTFVLPKRFPKLPAALLAVFSVTVIAQLGHIFLGLSVPVLGSIRIQQLEGAHLQDFFLPALLGGNLGQTLSLLSAAGMVFGLASLETLLTAISVDKLASNQRHDPDQELIGQGFGNLASGFFGGMPITGAIARSALNIQAGAKTRRAAIFQAIFFAFAVFTLGAWIEQIPIAVLAGVVLSVGLRMLDPRELLQLWSSSRFEALIYLTTFVVILFVDLLSGIRAGLLAALLISSLRFGQIRSNLKVETSAGPTVMEIEGPLTFLNFTQLDSISATLQALPLAHGLILDLARVESMDASGATRLLELLEQMTQKKIKIIFRGVSLPNRKILFSQDHKNLFKEHIALTELDLTNALGAEAAVYGGNRLAFGVERFQKEFRSGYEGLFKKLADQQNPHTLFITCSDSRINPNLITATNPGDIFIVRNVGNLIPPFGMDGTPAEGAAIEFSLGVLGVQQIVVCGHSGCGAMKAILSDDFFSPAKRSQFPSLTLWLEIARDLKNHLPAQATPEEAAELNAVLQLENLKTYPIIQERLASGKLRIDAWYYNIGESELLQWDETKKLFSQVTTSQPNS